MGNKNIKNIGSLFFSEDRKNKLQKIKDKTSREREKAVNKIKSTAKKVSFDVPIEKLNAAISGLKFKTESGIKKIIPHHTSKSNIRSLNNNNQSLSESYYERWYRMVTESK